MFKKAVTEQMSLVPPIGGVGSAIKPTQSSTLGVGTKKSQTAAITQNLVKRINDVSAAKKVNQQQLLQLVNQLKQSIAQEESNEETAKRKLAKEGINIKPSTIGRIGGSIVGGLAGGAAAVAGGPIGVLAGRAVGAELGSVAGEKIANKIAPDKNGEDDEEKSKKNKRRKLNNKKDTLMAKNKSNLQEGLGGGILGGIAGAMIPGAPILGAIGGSALGSKIEDKALSQNEQSDVQADAVTALEKRGYKVTRSYSEEHGKVIVLSKKPNRFTTVIAEVDPDGTVNGQSLSQFLNEVEENEEQKLSKAQQKIAVAAPPYDKITGADFKALKAVHKEAVTTTNFLKAISQKNYAQADKYLGSLVNEKLKRIINKASK